MISDVCLFQTELISLADIIPAWPGIVRGIDLSASSGSQQALAFAKKCLNMCDARHSQCRSSSTQTPTRLIELSQEDASRVRLVETTPSSSEVYIALSYCWGRGDNLKTTTANYNQMLSTFSVSTLPQTLQDAIWLTRQLGQRYIWIDAICIIQDSASDWEIESATMASVYRNAYLTIAAGTAASATEGFLTHEYPAGDYPVPFQRSWCTDEGLDSILAARMIPDLETHTEDGEEVLPLDTRGWCLQERLLSIRLLTYKDHELYWTCLASTMCECNTRDHLSSQLIRVADDNRIPYVSLFEMTKEEAWDKWKLVVQEYMFRSFTNVKDILPAIAGVATIVQALTGSEYLGGLWKDNLVKDMAWEAGDIANHHMPTFRCALEHYIAPTFSWASSPYTISYEEGVDSSLVKRNMTWVSKCQILDTGCVLDGSNPLGRVQSGHVRLKGPVLKATMLKAVEPGHSSDRYTWLITEGDLKVSFRADTRLEECLAITTDGNMERSVRRSPHGSSAVVLQSGAPVFLLYLGKSVGTYLKRKKWTRMFLLLGRSPAHARAFERLGTVTMGDYGETKKLNRRKVGFQELEITLV